MQPKRRILFFSHNFHPIFSGAGNKTLILAKKLIEMGYEVKILTHNPDNLPESEYYESMEIIRYLYKKSKNKYIELILWFVNAIIINRKIFSLTFKFDIVHIIGGHVGLTAAIASKILGKKVIYTAALANGDEPKGFKRDKGIGWINYCLLFLCNHYTCISKLIEKNFLMINDFKEKVVFIPNFADINKFYPSQNEKVQLRKKFNIDLDVYLLLFVGDVSERKNVAELVRIVSEIKNEKILLVIAGPKSDNDYLRSVLEIINKCNINSRVKFTGRIDNVEEYYRMSDIFLFTSRREGSPSVLYEAMSSGLPVITYNLPGITDQLIEDGKDGFCLKYGDQIAFIERLNALLNNKDLRTSIGENARKKMESQYSLNYVAKLYSEYYN